MHVILIEDISRNCPISTGTAMAISTWCTPPFAHSQLGWAPSSPATLLRTNAIENGWLVVIAMEWVIYVCTTARSTSSYRLNSSLHCLFPIIGHGNHKEDSPFLNSPDEKNKNDFYDQNLALFEVFWTLAVKFKSRPHLWFIYLFFACFFSLHSSPLSAFRKSWTSDPRCHLCSVVWSATQTSPRERRSMRRRRAQGPRKERLLRSVPL